MTINELIANLEHEEQTAAANALRDMQTALAEESENTCGICRYSKSICMHGYDVCEESCNEKNCICAGCRDKSNFEWNYKVHGAYSFSTEVEI